MSKDGVVSSWGLDTRVEGRNAELAEVAEEESHFEVVAQGGGMLLALGNKLDLKALPGLWEKKVLKLSPLLSRMEHPWPWWSWTGAGKGTCVPQQEGARVAWAEGQPSGGRDQYIHLCVYDSFFLKSAACLRVKCGEGALCRLHTAFGENSSEMHSQSPVSYQHCHGTCTVT